MGYQESLIKLKNNNDLNEIALYLDNNSDKLDIFMNPCSIVTFKNLTKANSITFIPEEKCICIQGERFANNKQFIFQYEPKLISKVDIVSIDEIEDDKLDKIFNTQELAEEQPFKEYIELLNKKNENSKNITREKFRENFLKGVYHVCITEDEFKNMLKDYKDDDKKIKDKFNNEIKTINPWSKKEAAYGYLDNLMNLYDNYGDAIKYIDEEISYMVAELKEKYGLKDSRIKEIVASHESKEIEKPILIYHLVDNEKNFEKAKKEISSEVER